MRVSHPLSDQLQFLLLKIVHTIGGIGEAPFVIKGRVNKNKFTPMIDSGSSGTIIMTKDMKDILRTDVLF